MELLLILILFGLLFAGWKHFRNRVEELETRINILAARVQTAINAAPVPGQVAVREQYAAREMTREPAPERLDSAPPSAPPEPVAMEPVRPEPGPEPASEVSQPAPQAPVWEEPPQAEPVSAPAFEPPAARQPRLTPDWEATLGGNWMNKAGVLVLVVGIALALAYSFTQLGPAGRVAIGLAASLTMLVAGVAVERREPYRTFARGLIGGGWAALYFTVYAMHALPAARVIENAVAGAALLLAVAIGMILHSLRYRSQTVSGLAYFIAFATLAITEATPLSMLALIPLAASLLFVAHRFAWSRMALLGLVATYSVIVLHGDTGAPLWQAQAVFTTCWLMFEAFDIMHAEERGNVESLLPLNAVGFLGLSLQKWHAAAPDSVWVFLTAAALAYFGSALLRARSGKWHGAATLTAAIAAAAIFQKLDHQWVASALVVEAELFYLAGVRLRAPYLRWLGTSLFAVEAVRLLESDVNTLPVHTWAPVAALDAGIFYANRALYAADIFYGYAAALMIAVIAGGETTEPTRGATWFVLAAGPFAVGWWRGLRDFRIQGYGLGLLGVMGLLFAAPQPPAALAIGMALSYALALSAVFSGSRFDEAERDVVRLAGALGASIGAAALIWRVAPAEYLGLSWMALAIVLLELGLRGLPRDLCGPAYAAAAAGASRLLYSNLVPLHSDGPLVPRLIPAGAAVLAYSFAARARAQKRGIVLAAASTMGTIFLLVALWALWPDGASASWAAVALALFYIGSRLGITALRGESYAVAALAFLRCWIFDIANAHNAILNGVAAIVSLYGAQFAAARGSRVRLYYSLLATSLTTLLLYYQSSGSMLTVAWGVEGVALLASGFPLRDRVLRVSGLALLLMCIGKLFAWDLRHLETLPRILSFIVLGLLLVGVSWIYTRFRERVASVLQL